MGSSAMRVNLQNHRERSSGYGRMGYEIERSLRKMGVEIMPRMDDGYSGQSVVERTGERPVSVQPQDAEIAPVALWLSTPPAARRWFEGQLATILTMWESTDMPAGFRENLPHFDRIFVPSQQNQELFSRFHGDVRVVPLGVDPETWAFRPRPRVDRDFNFVTAGFGPRKNCKKVVEAFQMAFPGANPLADGPVPKLYVRSRDEISGRGVYRIGNTLTEAEEVAFYGQAHCYVSGSRGEGWGLMPLQAIAQGCPTILVGEHGHKAFSHLGIEIGWDPISAAGATFWGDGGEWWEPRLDDMVEAMRQVYAGYEDAAAHAEKASAEALTRFTWDLTAEKLIYELPELFLDPPTERVWHESDPILYLVRVGVPCSYIINGVRHDFRPSTDYYETADLKKQLTVHGQLDLSCFDPDEIGVPAALVDQYRSRNERCPSCSQRYNSDPSLLAVLESTPVGI